MSRLSRSVPVLAGVVVLGLAGCTDGSGPAADDAEITVVASTNVWGSVAEAVGGGQVGVDSLIADSAADPHAHPDKPEDATALARADLVVYNGGGYDDFFTALIEGTGTQAKRVDAFALSGRAAGDNEHVWYDLPTVRKVADEIAAALGALAPDRKAAFAANAADFGTKVEQLAAEVEQVGAAGPGARVVATEPVAHYLLDAAGLTDATPTEFSEAIEEETDPPVSAVAETTGLISGKRVAVLVNNAQTETPVTDSLNAAARQAGVPIVTVTETLPPGVTDYVVWMTKQVDDLVGALAKA